MDLAKQIRLIKSWGFNPLTKNDTMFTREAPMGYTEVWTVNSPDGIDFYTRLGHLSHTQPIHWHVIEKHFD